MLGQGTRLSRTPALHVADGLPSVDRHSFGLACSFLQMRELVRLQTVCRALQLKAVAPESWQSRLGEHKLVRRASHSSLAQTSAPYPLCSPFTQLLAEEVELVVWSRDKGAAKSLRDLLSDWWAGGRGSCAERARRLQQSVRHAIARRSGDLSGATLGQHGELAGAPAQTRDHASLA